MNISDVEVFLVYNTNMFNLNLFTRTDYVLIAITTILRGVSWVVRYIYINSIVADLISSYGYQRQLIYNAKLFVATKTVGFILYAIHTCIDRLIKNRHYIQSGKVISHLLLNIPISTSIHQKSGTVTSHITGYTSEAMALVSHIFQHTLSELIFLLSALRGTWNIHKLLCFYIIIWILLTALIQLIVNIINMPLIKQKVIVSSERSGVYIETCNTNPLIKCFDLKDYIFNRINNKYNDPITSLGWTITINRFLSLIVSNILSLILVDYLGCFRLVLSLNKKGISSLLGIILMCAFSSRCIIHHLFEVYQHYQQYTLHRKYIDEYIIVPKNNEANSMLPITHAPKTIKITNMYKKIQEKILFKNVSFNLKSGETMVIMGPSGCGKTTLVNMILGLDKDDTNQSSILINNIPIRLIKNIMQYSTYIMQSDMVMNLTIRENIHTGRLDASNDDIKNIATSLGLDDLDRMVSADGLDVSGGEMKRMCFARAMLKYRPGFFIVADEITGGLDPDNAQNLIHRVLKKCKNSNSIGIFIEHSNITAPLVDKVLFYDDNQKTFILSTHEELTNTNDRYRKYYNN